MITFKFISGYRDACDYWVYGDGAAYRVSVRFAAAADVPASANYTQAAWARDVIPSVGLLVRMCDAVPQAVVDAFNAWRLADHFRQRREIEAQPERYGIVDWDNDPQFAPPVAVRTGSYSREIGWQIAA